MKILIVTNLFPPVVLGGYEILCHQVVDALEDAGHTVTVLTSTQGDLPSTDSIIRELHVFQPFDKKVEGAMRREKLRAARHNAQSMKDLLAKSSFDVIFMWSMLRLTPSCAAVAESSEVPVVYTFNDEHPSGYLPARFALSPRAFIRWVLDATVFKSLTNRSLQFEFTTCISKLLKENLLKAGMPIGGSQVIYQGIPITQFPLREQGRRNEGPLRLLYAGQLHAYKGVHTLMEALGLVAENDDPIRYQCSIVGAGTDEYEKQLASHAERLRIPVSFMGKVTHEEMAALYRSHDVLIFPSIWPEPFGLTHLEAMASGLPVISTVNGGQGEFLVDGVNCLSFPPSDAACLAHQIQTLADDPALYQSLVEAGRDTVEKGFTFSRYVADLQQLLKKAISQAR